MIVNFESGQRAALDVIQQRVAIVIDDEPKTGVFTRDFGEFPHEPRDSRAFSD